MKANELMVGDWVRVKAPYFKKNKAYRVVEVRLQGHNGVTTANIELPDEDDEACMTGEFLLGIPLTQEILEKNGFKYNPDAYAFPVPAKCYDFPLGQGFFIEQLADGSYRITDHCFVSFRYVHELQHALRLCGIEKEIEL